MKKWILTPLLVLAVGVTLSGCSAGAANTMNTTAAPMATQAAATMNPTMIPEASASPDMAGNEMTGMATTSPDANENTAPVSMTPTEAGRLAERISEAVERLSEVDDAETIINDNRVLVAVEFDDQYSAGLDDRMKQMIVEQVQEIDETLTEVEITDDNTLYGQVKGLGERLAKATGLDELADDFGDLWDRVTGM